MSKPKKEAIETPLRGPVYHSLHKRFIQNTASDDSYHSQEKIILEIDSVVIEVLRRVREFRQGEVWIENGNPECSVKRISF